MHSRRCNVGLKPSLDKVHRVPRLRGRSDWSETMASPGFGTEMRIVTVATTALVDERHEPVERGLASAAHFPSRRVISLDLRSWSPVLTCCQECEVEHNGTKPDDDRPTR